MPGWMFFTSHLDVDPQICGMCEISIYILILSIYNTLNYQSIYQIYLCNVIYMYIYIIIILLYYIYIVYINDIMMIYMCIYIYSIAFHVYL